MADENSELQKNWYVIQAYSGYENYVKKALAERISQNELEHKFEDIVVPTEEVVEMRGGSKRKSTRKFFPGYVLVKMAMDESTWHLVRHTPRVLGFVGGKRDRPEPITQKEADAILRRVEDSADQPVHKVVFEPGEVIRVIDGHFADFDGVVEDINYEKNRLRVAVLIFGRSTPVELDFNQVEKS